MRGAALARSSRTRFPHAVPARGSRTPCPPKPAIPPRDLYRAGNKTHGDGVSTYHAVPPVLPLVMERRETAQFERVVLPHLDDAYALAFYLVRDQHDAQDLVQDAVLRALRHFDGFRDGDARSWLLAIVRNCCHSFLTRRRDPGLSLSIDEAEHAPQLHHAIGADDRAIRSSERAAIERALAELPIEFREVIILREINDLSYKEISLITGAPVGTVMSRLARARRRLASDMGLLYGEAG